MKERISLIYNLRKPYLYGCIQFFKSSTNQKPATLQRQSAPFVISQSVYSATNKIERLRQTRLNFHVAAKETIPG